MTQSAVLDPVPGLTIEEKRELRELLEERERRAARRKIFSFYPDTGPLRRELYRPHMEFFRAGATHRQRILMGPNRMGKTEGVNGYEVALHLTGRYPEWWQGRRFDRPVRSWLCGKTAETVREILQQKMLGPANASGTGLIPGDDILRITRAAGMAESADTVYVKHITGGASVLMFKSYDQGRRAYEGVEQDVIGFDEEPPLDIYTEGLMRTMTTNGIILCTFTPLLGLSATVLHFLGGSADFTGGDKGGGRYMVFATWDDAPHLSAEDRREIEASIPAHQKDARTKGIPVLGAGAIYPVPEADIVIQDFRLPEYWPQAYGLDVGWNMTGAVWGAYDASVGITYITGEYRRGQAEPVIHASAIKSRGDWIRGVVDPAARGRSQKDGEQLFKLYTDRPLGLHLDLADNAVDAGLARVWELLSTGRLKVFRSCTNWIAEFRLYRRDEKGRIVKENDHLMDATRYLIMSGMRRASVRPNKSLDRIGSTTVLRR